MPLRREQLELEQEHIPIGGMRPTVDFQHERVFLPLAEADGLHQPCLNIPPLRAVKSERFWRDERDGSEECAIRVCQPSRLCADYRRSIDVAGVESITEIEGECIAVRREGEGLYLPH